MEVDLLIDEVSQGYLGKSINRTFQCNSQQEWVDTATNSVVSSVACAEVTSNGIITISPPSTTGVHSGTTLVSSTNTGEQVTTATNDEVSFSIISTLL